LAGTSQSAGSSDVSGFIRDFPSAWLFVTDEPQLQWKSQLQRPNRTLFSTNTEISLDALGCRRGLK
jgi:hypothetical protein